MTSNSNRDPFTNVLDHRRSPSAGLDQGPSSRIEEGYAVGEKEYRGGGPAESKREVPSAKTAREKIEAKSYAQNVTEFTRNQGSPRQSHDRNGNRHRGNGKPNPVLAATRHQKTGEAPDDSTWCLEKIVHQPPNPRSLSAPREPKRGLEMLYADVHDKQLKRKEHKTSEKKVERQFGELPKSHNQLSPQLRDREVVRDDFFVGKANQKMEYGSDEPIGAHLLIHPLRQLEGLIDLALFGTTSNESTSNARNNATLGFLRYHIAQSFQGLSGLAVEISNLNYSLRSPSTDQEWTDAMRALDTMVEKGVRKVNDLSSRVMKVAWNVTDLDEERKWRSWWYWANLRRQDRRRNMEKEIAKAESRDGDGGVTDKEDGEDVNLDMAGSKLANFASINKFSKEMSDEERQRAEKQFYETVLSELRKLPQQIGTIENMMGARAKSAANMMIQAISKDEELRMRELTESGEKIREQRPNNPQIEGHVAKEGMNSIVSDNSVWDNGVSSKGATPAPTELAPRAGRGGYSKGREPPDRSRVEKRRTYSEGWPSSPSSRSSTAHQISRKDHEVRESGARSSRNQERYTSVRDI